MVQQHCCRFTNIGRNETTNLLVFIIYTRLHDNNCCRIGGKEHFTQKKNSTHHYNPTHSLLTE